MELTLRPHLFLEIEIPGFVRWVRQPYHQFCAIRERMLLNYSFHQQDCLGGNGRDEKKTREALNFYGNFACALFGDFF